MLNEEEWAIVWFDYHDYSFSKVEQILTKFNQISDIFDKNLIKNAIFDKNMFPDLKDQLLNLNYDKFVVNGQVQTMADESYTSHNTNRLDVEGTVKKILTTDYVQEALKAWEAERK